MSTPVVVKGTQVRVGDPLANPAPNPYGGGVQYGAEVTQGNQEQGPKKTGCNDPIFALLFYGNVAAIAIVAVMYGRAAMADGSAVNYVPYV